MSGINEIAGGEAELTGDDCIQPFRLDSAGFHGRLLRLGPTVDTIVKRHDYPDPVAGLISETLALAGVLSAALKFDGVFTLQLSGDGPVRFLVGDVTSAGDMRAYASFRGALPPVSEIATAPVPRLIGAGHIALTVDQSASTDRYQGIVDIEGGTLSDCIHHYFRQSDQFSAALKLCAGRDEEGRWRAAALMLQRSPETEDPNLRDETEEAWRHALVMLGSCTDKELLHRQYTPFGLLYRLFHEDGVRVFDARPVQFGCRCSIDKVKGVLASLSDAEITDLMVDGEITVTCEFCREAHAFDSGQIARMRTPYGAGETPAQ